MKNSEIQQMMYDIMHISPVEWMWIFILVTPAMIYLFLSDNDDFRK